MGVCNWGGGLQPKTVKISNSPSITSNIEVKKLYSVLYRFNILINRLRLRILPPENVCNFFVKLALTCTHIAAKKISPRVVTFKG